VDPFDPNSPLKKASVEHFPPDVFFVLRVVQLLRGIAQGEGVVLVMDRGFIWGLCRVRKWARCLAVFLQRSVAGDDLLYGAAFFNLVCMPASQLVRAVEARALHDRIMHHHPSH
jgi:hypothetical protein